MYCTKCGNRTEPNDRFCARCGAPVTAERVGQAAPVHSLTRPTDRKMIAGVCAGFARYFEVDVALMRILWLAMTVLSGGLGIIVYLAAWIIMPADPAYGM